MAPTICSDKKTQIRSGIKDIRKQSTTSSLSTSPSSAINYAHKRSKLIRPYPVRGKHPSTDRYNITISDVSSSEDTSDRSMSIQSPLSINSDNPMSPSSESTLLSPLSLSSFASLSTESCSPCAERLNPFFCNSDLSSVFSTIANRDENEDDEDISRSSSGITSDSQSSQSNATTMTTLTDNSKPSRPLSEIQLDHHEKNTKGLFEIAIKTIKLVRRNQLLQRRLAQLQLETSEFIQSVLANPENRALRDKMQPKSNCDHEMI